MPRVLIEVVPVAARVQAGLAGLVDPAGSDTVGVAIDVLRATSTLTRALCNGAVGVVPFADPAAALAFRKRNPGSLACGERDGAIVPGFDLGNSPLEYTRDRVSGRTLAFASTNGSRAMLSQSGCRVRLLGAFINASAVVRACADAAQVCLTCAGDRGQISHEDLACAGWIAQALVERGFEPTGADTALAIDAAPNGAEAVRTAVEDSPHARALAMLGADFQRDVAYCAMLNVVPHCPTW
ncbi:MAG: 2-phosphosulfolactate phosphatase [Candidatus Eisenbacteria bacterium]